MAFLEDQEKQILLERYFDIEWSDEVSDLRCVHCHRVAISHCVSTCQHLFCRTCSKFYSDELQLKCPQCQEFITQPDAKDFEVEVKIHLLKIFCPNKKHGCKHADQLRRIPSHLMTCRDTPETALPGKAPVELTSLNDAIGELREGNGRVEEKLRELETNVERNFNQFERTTDEIKSKVKVLTGKTTIMNNKLKGLELASKESTEQIQSMKSLLESIDQRLEKMEILHQQTMLQKALKENKFRNTTALNNQAFYDKQSKEFIRKAEYYEWTIADVKKNTLTDHWIFESDVFKFIGYKYEIKAKMEKKDGRIGIYLQFKDGVAVNEEVQKNGFTKIKYIIRHQREFPTKKDIVYENQLTFSDCCAQPTWIFGQGMSSSILSPPYTMNDTIKITIVFESPIIGHCFISNNGFLIWRIDNYRKRKQEHFYNKILSPTFYTGPQGYRVESRLIINHKGPMKVEVHFLTGEHDTSLSIEFPHKTTVTLFNQADPLKKLVKSLKRDDVKLYTVQLDSSESIEQKGFIKDDSLLLQISIEPEATKKLIQNKV